MRILFVLHQFYPEFSGGTEHVALNLARAAQRAGHYAHVLACAVGATSINQLPSTLDGALHSVYQGVPVTLIPRAALPLEADFSFETSPELSERLSGWMRKERFDLAHVLHPMRMGSVLLALQHCGMPYLLTLTDFFAACFRINLVNVRHHACAGPDGGSRCASECLVSPWTRASLASRYQQAIGVLSSAGMRVCPSEYVAGRYRDIFPDQDFLVIPHGIDLLEIAERKSDSFERKSEGLTFGFIGSIVPQKGLDFLLRAFARVKGENLRLKVIGGLHGEPAYQRDINRLVAADTRVELLGWLPAKQVFQEIQSLDLLCLPSRVPETFSLVLHEAAAAGVPAMVSAMGAPCERVARHGGGLVLPVDDEDAWVDAIASLVDRPGQLHYWRANLPLPLRLEEEAFFYESLYRRLLRPT